MNNSFSLRPIGWRRPAIALAFLAAGALLFVEAAPPAHSTERTAPAAVVNLASGVSKDLDSVAEHNEEVILEGGNLDLQQDLFTSKDATFGLGSSPTAKSTYIRVTCKGKVLDPHYSKGAKGAIFKTRITCTGTGVSSVRVRVNSGLYFQRNSNSNRVPRANSDYNQTVAVNGDSKTYYVPLKGNGGTGKGIWTATSSWQIIEPGRGTVGSKTIQVKKNIQK